MNKDLNPSCNYKHCKSFFQIHYQEMRWNKSTLPLIFNQYQYEDDVFYVRQKGELKKKNFKLLDQYLCYKKKNDKIVWLNYENAIIEFINDEKFGLGISLTKCFDKIEFFGQAQIWYKLMKRYAVQYDFNSQYTLLKKNGKIKFGDQYKGKCSKDNLEYTIKIYQKSQLYDENDIEQFIKEITILRQFQTDLTIKFYELFESLDAIFVIVEYLSTNSLEEYIEKNPVFSEEKAAKVIFRLIKIVAYLHSKNIMHRDIKLENIIIRTLDNLDSICLNDFKLAEIYDPKGDYQYKRCGTVGYVAPEILTDQNYDLKVDIFSVGIVMYILIMGKEPFDGIYEEKLIKNLQCDIDFSEIKISQLGINFLKGLLNIDQHERLTAHQALNHRWFQQQMLAKVAKFQIKTTFQRVEIKSQKTSFVLKIPANITTDKSQYSIRGSQSQRVKTLPEQITPVRSSLRIVPRRITSLLLNPVLFGKIK